MALALALALPVPWLADDELERTVNEVVAGMRAVSVLEESGSSGSARLALEREGLRARLGRLLDAVLGGAGYDVAAAPASFDAVGAGVCACTSSTLRC
jgi:hypothetical protein